MRYAIDSGPHIRDDDSTDLIYKRLLMVLIPIVLFSLYKNVFLVFIENKYPLMDVFYPLIILVVSCFTSFVTERLYVWIDSKRNGYKKFTSFYSIIPGIYLALILPINIPIYIVIIGAVVASLFGKMIYGGFGENLFNPTAMGFIFLIVLFGSTFSNYSNYLNPMEAEKYSTIPITSVASFDYDKSITPYGSLFNFLFGTVPGSLGTTNAFLMMISFALLTILKVIKWKISVSFIATVFFMTFMIGANHEVGIWYPVFNILSGSLLFVAIFMSDPVTTATTSTGQILNGIGLGILTVCIRLLMANPERILIAVLLMNILTPYLDKLGVISLKDPKYKYIFIALAVVLGVVISFVISGLIK